jgi:hypothetical protein
MGEGGWFADGVDLSRLAWNVTHRSAGWNVAGRRGENLVVAGRAGEVFAEKVPDAGSGTLDMWAVGALPDGSMPTQRTLREQARANLDTLTRLFGRGRLIELVRADDRAVYGKRNLVENPGAERSTASVVLNENLFTNPSGETTTPLPVTIRRNLVANPSMARDGGIEVIRRNLVRNPAFQTGNGRFRIRLNLVRNPSFEVNAKQWDPGTNGGSTIERVSRPVAAVSGRNMLKVTRTGDDGTNAQADGSCHRLEGNTPYTASAYVRNIADSARDFRITILWRDSKGTALSSSVGDTVSVTPDFPTRLSVTATAPVAADYAFVRIVALTGKKDESYLLDAVMLETSATLGDYFDGSTRDHDGLNYRWYDDAGNSPSEEYGIDPMGWRTATDGVQIRLSDKESVTSTRAARIEVTNTSLSAGTVLLAARRANCGDAIGEGDPVAGRISLRPFQGTVAHRLQVSLVCYDSDGVRLGDAPGTTATVTLDAGVWQPVTVAGTTLAGTAKVGWQVLSAGTWAKGDGLYADRALIEQAYSTDDYFDGDSRDDEDGGYSWEGDPDWSMSVLKGSTPYQWYLLNGRGTRSTVSAITDSGTDWMLRVRSITGTNANPTVYADAVTVVQGAPHTLQARVKHNRAGASARVRIVWSDGSQAVSTSTTLTTAGQWYVLSVTGDCPANATGATVYVETISGSQTGDVFYVDWVMLEPVRSARTYFDGDSGKNFRWLGDDARSESVREAPGVMGWAPYGTADPVLYASTANPFDGSRALQVWASDAGTCGVTAGQSQVDPSTAYSLTVACWDATARTFTAAITWYGEDGNEISTSQSSTAVSAGTWTRVSTTATAPVGAVTAAPTVWAVGVATNEVVRFDAARFGFGSFSTYADGNTSGWAWAGVPHASESQQLGAGIDGWKGTDVTVAQATTSSRGFPGSGLVYAAATVTGSNPVVQFQRQRVDDHARMRLRRAASFTVGADVSPSANAIFEWRLMPYRWTGWNWRAAGGPLVSPSVTTVTTAQGRTRVTATFTIPEDQWPTASHIAPELSMYATSASGGTPTYPSATQYPGTVYPGSTTGGTGLGLAAVVYVDRVLAAYDVTDTSYFDGDTAGCTWTGDRHASDSIRLGTGRRAWVEVSQPIDMSSMAGGTRAEFAVEYRRPEPYWEDLTEQTLTIPLGRIGRSVLLTALVGGTAPIEDALIRVEGAVTDLTVTDVGSGAWLRINRTIKNGRSVTVSNADWSVVNQKGDSVVQDVSHAGHARWLPLTPVDLDGCPRLKFDADSIGRGARLVITARKRYLIG